MTKNKFNQITKSKNLNYMKWILFVAITLCIGKSNAQIRVANSTKKDISKTNTKSKSASPKMATNNKKKPKLEKIEVPQNESAATNLKVVPRPKIPKGKLAIFKNGQYTFITTKKKDNLEVSANCFENRTTCTALDIGQTKATSLQSPTGQVSNPASTLCDQLLGKNFIAIDFKGSEFDYCGFNDGSFVDTWTLLSKVMQK